MHRWLYWRWKDLCRWVQLIILRFVCTTCNTLRGWLQHLEKPQQFYHPDRAQNCVETSGQFLRIECDRRKFLTRDCLKFKFVYEKLYLVEELIYSAENKKYLCVLITW